MDLNKQQIKFLRKESHKHRSIFQMGKQGLSQAFIDQVDLALEKRELVKFNLLQNTLEDVLDVASKIAQELNAAIVHVVGHSAVLYRPAKNPKNQKLSPKVQNIKA